MNKLFIFSFFFLATWQLQAQVALPAKTFQTMRDSSTSIDVVFIQGAGGSISAEGKNAKLFGTFFDSRTAKKTSAPQTGTIMWQINGREFLSGNFFLGDTTGYVVIKKDDKEFVNRINADGNKFFKGQIKK